MKHIQKVRILVPEKDVWALFCLDLLAFCAVHVVKANRRRIQITGYAINAVINGKCDE